jgi:hypothetical protein
VTEPSINIALWLERRLDKSLGFHLPAARLYGIVVNDADALLDGDEQAARCSFIDERRNPYELIGGSAGVLARSFDAVALVTGGWAAPLDDDGHLRQRASRHPDRRRVRAVAVVSEAGVSSVLRFEDDPDHPIAQPDRGFGEMVDALESMWFGDPVELDESFVNVRTTRGGCTRRP